MPIVSTAETIAAPMSEIWSVLTDVERYPDRMDPVKSIRILSRDGDNQTTEWTVTLKGNILQWTQNEHYDAGIGRIEYRQIEGDLEQFEGFWQVTELAPDLCRVELRVEFDIGIPTLRSALNPVAERALRENSRKMLLALHRRAEDDGTTDARTGS